jgi:hypothetical protein
MNFENLGKTYEKQKYCIINNFTNFDEKQILEYYDTCRYGTISDLTGGPYAHVPGLRTLRPPGDMGPFYEVRLGGAEHNTDDNAISKLFRELCLIRTKVLYYASNPLIMKTFSFLSGRSETTCSLEVANSITEAEWKDLTMEIMKTYQGWSRFMHYDLEHHCLFKHVDSADDIIAILLLSRPGYDYTGGLFMEHPVTKEITCVDSLMSKNDLLIIDGNYYKHWVEQKPITTKSRFSYFINMNPCSIQGAKIFSEVLEEK